MKGFTLTGLGSDVGGVEWDENKCDNRLERKDEWDVVSPLGREGFGIAPGFSEGGLRLRGMGGGMTGRPPYRCVSSASVGMGVVRALGERAYRQLSERRDSNGEAVRENSLDDHDRKVWRRRGGFTIWGVWLVEVVEYLVWRRSVITVVIISWGRRSPLGQERDGMARRHESEGLEYRWVIHVMVKPPSVHQRPPPSCGRSN